MSKILTKDEIIQILDHADADWMQQSHVDFLNKVCESHEQLRKHSESLLQILKLIKNQKFVVFNQSPDEIKKIKKIIDKVYKTLEK